MEDEEKSPTPSQLAPQDRDQDGSGPEQKGPPPKDEVDASAYIIEKPNCVIEHQIKTETFSKEDKALHRLADLQRASQVAQSTHLAYKPNPYNRRTYIQIHIDPRIILKPSLSFYR